MQKVWRDPDLIVSEAKARCTEGDEDLNLIGCYGAKKNICRTHGCLGFDEIRQLDQLTTVLSSWVDSIGKEAAAGCEHLLWLKADPAVTDALPASSSASAGSSDVPPRGPMGFMVNLVSASYKPKCQVFARCSLVGSQAVQFSLPTDLPFKALIPISYLPKPPASFLFLLR